MNQMTSRIRLPGQKRIQPVTTKGMEFFEKRNAIRKAGGVCPRCLVPHIGEFKQCDECRKKGRDSRNRKKQEMVLVESQTLARLERRIEILEHNFDMMRLHKQRIYAMAHARGKKLGLQMAKYHETPEISFQEVSEIGHTFNPGR